MGDNERCGGNEKIVHSVKLPSNWLGMDGVVRRITTGQGYYLNTTRHA
jgi:hypothetical protein